MTDFIPFGSPPGATGNPKYIIADEFKVGQKIKVKTTGVVNNDNPSNGGGEKGPLEVEAIEAIISFTPDRRPFLAVTYANQRTHNFAWGMNNTNYRKTPATGAPMDNPATNGRVDLLNQKIIEAQTLDNTLNANLFERYMVHCPVGSMSTRNSQRGAFPLDDYTGGYQFGFSSDQMVMDGNTHAELVSIPPKPATDVPPTAWFKYPNPYTDNGYPLSSETILNGDGSVDDGTEKGECQVVDSNYDYTGNTLGNVRQAWAGAIQHIKDQLANQTLEFAAYLGYGLTYADVNRNTWYPTLGTLYDRRDAQMDMSNITADPPLPWDFPVWDSIAESVPEYGFSRVWFDYGRPHRDDSIADDVDNCGSAIVAAASRTFGNHDIKIGYEAVPREDGTGVAKPLSYYTDAPYMVDFPENCTWNDGTETWGNGTLKLDTLDLSADADKTEVHVWLSTSLFWNGGTIVSSGTDRAWDWPKLKSFIDQMYAQGLIVSFDQALASQIDGTRKLSGLKDISIQEVFQYVNELYANGSATDPNATLNNIRSFNQMELPSDEAFPSAATEDYEIMLSGYVYINPTYGSGGGDLSNITIAEAAALTIDDFKARINTVVTGVNPIAATTRQQIPDSYTGYVGYDLEQPMGLVQGLTSHALNADTTTANESIFEYDDLDAAGKTAYDQTIQAVGRSIIAHSLEFPNAKLAVYGLGLCTPNGQRFSTSANDGTYKFRKEMYTSVLNYVDGGITVADVIDLALVKQYANSGWANFTYPLSFNPDYTGTNTFQNGIRESFRWMLPQVFAAATANTDHIKVAVLSSQIVENATAIPDNVYTYMQANALWEGPNGQPPANKDSPGKFAAMQYKQAQVAWSDAGMDPNRLLPLYMWGAPALDARDFYNQSALIAQDGQMTSFGNLDDVLVINDGDPNASNDPTI